ncbi:MAG: DUF2637 domain-containing protein [Pseudonocardiaceae bacterium]
MTGRAWPVVSAAGSVLIVVGILVDSAPVLGVALAAVAAVVSYAHMAELGHRADEGWRALLLPLSVDGLVVAGSMVLLNRRRAGLAAGWLPWVALLAGVGASLAANVAVAEPTVTARVVAAWPAVAFELLLQQRRPVVAPLAARLAAMVAIGRDTGRPVGRRTVARELGVSEHRATQLLAATNGRPS